MPGYHTTWLLWLLFSDAWLTVSNEEVLRIVESRSAHRAALWGGLVVRPCMHRQGSASTVRMCFNPCSFTNFKVAVTGAQKSPWVHGLNWPVATV